MTPVMWACYFDQYENMELLLNISHDDEMRFEIIDAELKDKDKMGRNLLHWSISNAVNRQCFKVANEFSFFSSIGTLDKWNCSPLTFHTKSKQNSQ